MKGFIMDRITRLEQEKTIANLYAIIASSGTERAAVEFLRDGQPVAWTYADCDRMARAYAVELSRAFPQAIRGMVAIKVDTCPEWTSVFWGILMAGYSPLLLDFTLNEEMTTHLLVQAGALGVVTRTQQNLPEQYRQIMFDDLISAPEAPADFTPRFGESVALCTSGTTSTSRIFVYNAVALSNQVLNSGLLYKINRYIIDDEPRRALAFLPLHHVFGFLVHTMWCPFVGYSNVFLKDRAPQTIVTTCNYFRVQLVVAVPLLINNLSVALGKKVAKEPPLKRGAFAAMKWLSLAIQTIAPHFGLRFARQTLFKSILKQLLGPDVLCIVLGGSHTPAKHMRTICALGYYAICGFGMTETALTSADLSMNVQRRISGSVGRPLPTAEYRVIPIKRGDRNRGEMQVRGGTLHTGRMVNGKLESPDVDGNGWYPTGDVVRLKRTGMWIEGRTKDVIINESGENVYPDELEDVFASIEGVEQFCVLGVAKKGDKRSKYHDITLVCNVGASYNDAQFLETLTRAIAQANGRLPILKRLSRAIVTQEKLPVVNAIKVKRITLREQIEGRKIAFQDLDLKAK